MARKKLTDDDGPQKTKRDSCLSAAQVKRRKLEEEAKAKSQPVNNLVDTSDEEQQKANTVDVNSGQKQLAIAKDNNNNIDADDDKEIKEVAITDDTKKEEVGTSPHPHVTCTL